MVESIVETFDLTKIYKMKKAEPILALNNVNISIEKGEIFGLLGPNGAGKTTLVEILTTLLQPTSGYAEVLGFNILKYPNKIKQKIGLMLGDEIIYYRLSGYDNLKFFCRIYGIKNYKEKVRSITTQLGIYNWLDQLVEKYSRGMKLRLALSRVLLIEPEILFLDEPMLGLDPESVKKVVNILLNLKKTKTILLTSHQMHIVEQTCDRIAFLNKGIILKVDTQEAFKKLVRETIHIKIEINSKKKKELIKELNDLNFIIEFIDEKNGGIIHIKDKKDYPELLKVLSNYPILKVQEIEPNLDDIFIELSKS
ncbi:MAG: ATP-binding cassette domain-containing protein [Promethearchaeota archaeon]